MPARSLAARRRTVHPDPQPSGVAEEETAVCRSIKTLRPPYQERTTDDDVRAAALQYVRKVSGFREPASHNAEVFEEAVAQVAAATQDLLDGLVVRGR